MPQIVVEYSAALTDSFDRRAFALELHETVATLIDSPVASFKTRFQRLDDVVIADGAADVAMVHVRLAVLSGRDGETKKAVADAAGAILVGHVTPGGPATSVQATVEIVDLDRSSYFKQVVAAV